MSNPDPALERLRGLVGNSAKVTLPQTLAREEAPGAMQRAREWADTASPSDLKAFALASYEAMPARDQEAFLAHIQGRRGQ